MSSVVNQDFMFLRFASVTVNLGPTFLSGALAANAGAVMDEPSCPLVQVCNIFYLQDI